MNKSQIQVASCTPGHFTPIAFLRSSDCSDLMYLQREHQSNQRHLCTQQQTQHFRRSHLKRQIAVIHPCIMWVVGSTNGGIASPGHIIQVSIPATIRPFPLCSVSCEQNPLAIVRSHSSCKRIFQTYDTCVWSEFQTYENSRPIFQTCF